MSVEYWVNVYEHIQALPLSVLDHAADRISSRIKAFIINAKPLYRIHVKMKHVYRMQPLPKSYKVEDSNMDIHESWKWL